MKRKVIALTGGIGSGKSEVRKIVSQMGFATVDCDEISKNVAELPEVVHKVEQLLGAECVSNWQLVRPKIRERIFTDQALYKSYSNIFWDKIAEILQEKVVACAGTVFVEIAVVDAFPFPWDEIWLVESDKSVRIDRVVQRDGVTKDNVIDIISKQKFGNYTRKIQNNGSFDSLNAAVREAVRQANI